MFLRTKSKYLQIIKLNFLDLHDVSEARIEKSSEQELSLSLPTSEDASITFSATFEVYIPLLTKKAYSNSKIS
jgi:hypothetical protein